MKLLKMCDMQKAKATSTIEVLWATPVRPDISFAVKELSRSLKAPTQQDEQQLKQVLGYIKGTLTSQPACNLQGRE